MAKYARFDHTAAEPAPVLGWYNCDARKHAVMPDEADLLELTEAEWAARLSGPFAVQGGKLVAGAPVVGVASMAARAKAALAASHETTLEMLEEGKPVPAAWTSYRRTLKAIIAGTTSPPDLPDPPA